MGPAELLNLTMRDVADLCDLKADAEVEANIAARQLGRTTDADRHLSRGQTWIRISEILRDLP